MSVSYGQRVDRDKFHNVSGEGPVAECHDAEGVMART